MQQAEAAGRDHSVPYTVTREYQLSSENAQQPKSQVVAQINFVPPSQKDYTVRKIEGSDRGMDIVRRVLEHESQMATHAESHQLNPRNYQFALVGQEAVEGHNCYVLQLTPNRHEPELVNGKAWVDASSFQVRRIEGTPAKSPSWWIHNLHVTINYGAVQGIWTQLATKAVADVGCSVQTPLLREKLTCKLPPWMQGIGCRADPASAAGMRDAKRWQTALSGCRARSWGSWVRTYPAAN